jgi:hypothetical protein
MELSVVAYVIGNKRQIESNARTALRDWVRFAVMPVLLANRPEPDQRRQPLPV